MADLLADVLIFGRKAGVVFWDSVRAVGVFEYTPEMIDSGWELAPLRMPLRKGPYQFPNLHESFQALPGLLADCLPDTYGNTLINEWLRSQGRDPTDFSPVERLCYVGSRGMGALEFFPSMRDNTIGAEKVEIDQLVELASQALAMKEGLKAELRTDADLSEILRVGTSAGGARAKAVITWNPETNEVRSGQAEAPEGFQHWLLKFDGVNAAFDGVRDPQGYGRIEYAYSLMAKEAGITMMPCRLFEEGGRAHFMTQRFDRITTKEGQRKKHFASLFGLAHMAYSAPGSHSHSYEDYFAAIAGLKLTPTERLEGYRRMAFNILGCNRDDHVKNFGFLFEPDSGWSLAPAYDVTYAHNPAPGKWTAKQQMSVMGKREGITRDDLLEAGKTLGIATAPRLKQVLDQVGDSLNGWKVFAAQADVAEENIEAIGNAISMNG